MPQPNKELLAKALPHVLAAPKDGAHVMGLCVRPDFSQRSFPSEITLSKANGVIGDRWLHNNWSRLPDGRPDPINQVSILSKRVLDLVWHPDENDATHPGDTVIADMDLSLENMPEGQLVKVGSAILHVSSYFNEGCVKWKTRYGADVKNWIIAPGHADKRLRGILLSIVQDGTIKLHDKITRL